MDDAAANGNSNRGEKLDLLLGQVQSLIMEAGALPADDVTDDRFKLEDKKRRIAQEVFEHTASKRLDAAKVDYAKAKQDVALAVQEDGNDKEKHRLREILAREQTFINSTNPERIETAISDLSHIRFSILMRKPVTFGMFEQANATFLHERSVANWLSKAESGTSLPGHGMTCGR